MDALIGRVLVEYAASWPPLIALYVRERCSRVGEGLSDHEFMVGLDAAEQLGVLRYLGPHGAHSAARTRLPVARTAAGRRQEGRQRMAEDVDGASLADEYLGEVVVAGFYGGVVVSVDGFADDLWPVASALEVVVRSHRPLGSGRRPVCLSCHTAYPCHTRGEITRRLTGRARPLPDQSGGVRPALFGPGRAVVTAGADTR